MNKEAKKVSVQYPSGLEVSRFYENLWLSQLKIASVAMVTIREL